MSKIDIVTFTITLILMLGAALFWGILDGRDIRSFFIEEKPLFPAQDPQEALHRKFEQGYKPDWR